MISFINPEDQFDPTAAILKAHCIGARGEDGVTHFAGVDKKPEVGEEVDLSNVLCSIAPPKIFNPEN